MTLAIIGCGNPNRSDDGVGPEIISRLRGEELPSEIKLFDAGTDGMGVMYQARGASHLIILDARAPEKEPGAIYEVRSMPVGKSTAKSFPNMSKCY